MDEEKLVSLAFQAKERAYAPYSDFPVGAALLTAEGKIYMGCNVESAAYGCAICAERTAMVSAVAAGEKNFAMMAVCADSEDFCTPCGICRQVLFEFAPDMPILCCNKKGEYKKLTVKELLPFGFRL